METLNLAKLWHSPRRVHGIELCFDSLLLLLRWFSLSYWLRRSLPDPAGQNRSIRDNAVDAYCVIQFFVLLAVLLLGSALPVGIATITSSYILFEVYLNLFNIVFIGKFADINAPPASIERSLLLIILNAIEVVQVFAVLYRSCLHLETQEAFLKATLVLGTIGAPDTNTPVAVALVSFQVLLDFVLVVLFLAAFSGQLNMFKTNKP